MTTPTPVRQWIAYLPPDREGDLQLSVGAGATEAEALADARRLLPRLADPAPDPADVYALLFDLYRSEHDVPEGVLVHTRGAEYLDGEHDVGVLADQGDG